MELGAITQFNVQVGVKAYKLENRKSEQICMLMQFTSRH